MPLPGRKLPCTEGEKEIETVQVLDEMLGLSFQVL